MVSIFQKKSIKTIVLFHLTLPFPYLQARHKGQSRIKKWKVSVIVKEVLGDIGRLQKMLHISGLSWVSILKIPKANSTCTISLFLQAFSIR